ncbi:MAG: tolB protein [Polyangiaceae bacterium]|nr:tolB protein [Polyangiaceae bacterium]
MRLATVTTSASKFLCFGLMVVSVLASQHAGAEPNASKAPASAPASAKSATPNETLLGEFVVTGVSQERLPKIAILPSLSPDFEDVVLRGVVRRDLELSGLFDLIDDAKAPPGTYAFQDPVDIEAWRKLGAESIVKVAAQKNAAGDVQVVGLAYFLEVGKEPVYEKRFVIKPDEVRVTGHRITDALLGALTGRPGGFASRFAFATQWGRNRRIFTMDADGNALTPATAADTTALSPAWGPGGSLFYSKSVGYAPFRLYQLAQNKERRIDLGKPGSIYSVAFNKDHTQMALAIADGTGTAIYTANPDGTNVKRVSTTPLATHPVFSPSGKLAWIGGSDSGTQRLWLAGKPISPAGFTAAAPTFCDTEDGIRAVYAVVVGDHQDLVISSESGKGTARLTQNQGSNSYPACSSDGRMLAFFSTRNKQPGLYMMSLKRFTTRKVANQTGIGLRWDPLPAPSTGAAPKPAASVADAVPPAATTAPASAKSPASAAASAATPTPTPATATSPATPTPVAPTKPPAPGPAPNKAPAPAPAPTR